jgi:ketosteroid isomerase-like protein
MSQENVELVRRLWAQFEEGIGSGDPGAWADSEVVAEDFEWILTEPLDGRSIWRGREEYGEFIRTWTDQFDDWSIRAERFIDAGDDQVVVLSHQTATGRESGVPVELKLWQVADLKDGRLMRMTIYFRDTDALEAAGLRA